MKALKPEETGQFVILNQRSREGKACEGTETWPYSAIHGRSTVIGSGEAKACEGTETLRPKMPKAYLMTEGSREAKACEGTETSTLDL